MSTSSDSPPAQAMFLRTLPAIRTRCAHVHDLAKKGALQYFDYNPERLDAVIEFCASIMQVRLGFFPSLFSFHPIDAWAVINQRDFANAFDTVRRTPSPRLRLGTLPFARRLASIVIV